MNFPLWIQRLLNCLGRRGFKTDEEYYAEFAQSLGYSLEELLALCRNSGPR